MTLTKVAQLLAAPPLPASAQFRQEKESRPEATDEINQIESLYTKKLYHQLTSAVEEYLVKGGLSSDDTVAFIYNVLFALRQKLNPVRTVALLEIAANRLEPQDALLLVAQFEPVFVDDKDAATSLSILRSNCLLRNGDLTEVSDLLLSQLSPELENQIGVAISVNSKFHLACSNYYKVIKNPQKFYKSTQLYLAYTSPNDLSIEQQQTVGFELCVAGLIAVDMFDFGDILSLPLLASLNESNRWIVDFVIAASEGNLGMFETALKANQVEAEKTFGSEILQLSRKMTLAALVDIAFKAPNAERQLQLSVIATHCKVPLEECERLVMKAMSVGLLKGSIDGIAGVLRLTWVKPRMVDPQRIEMVRQRFVAWSASVRSLVVQLEDSIPQLLV